MGAVPDQAVIVRGEGPAVVLVHGSGTDASTWGIQQSQVSGLRLIAYHRRGTPAWPHDGRLSTADHAGDLAAVIETYAGGRAAVCGSSYGAVVTLALAKERPALLSRAMLCEPPLPGSDSEPTVPDSFVATYEGIFERDGGPAAAEYFLRLVLGDGAFEALPRRWQERSTSLWKQIRSDIHALAHTELRDADLARIDVPIAVVAGERSARYRSTIDRLVASLPAASRHIIPGAGHMMHAQAARRFNALLLAFARPPS